MEQEKYIAYLVRDDEWEQVMSKEEVIVFTMERIDNADYIEEESIGNVIEYGHENDEVRKVLMEYLNNGTKITDIEIAKQILSIICFDVKELKND